MATLTFDEAATELKQAISAVFYQVGYVEMGSAEEPLEDWWKGFIARQPRKTQQEVRRLIARVSKPGTRDEARLATVLLGDIGEPIPDLAEFDEKA